MPPTLYEGPPPTGKPGPTGLPKMQTSQLKNKNRDDGPSSPVLTFGGIAIIIVLGGYLTLRHTGGATAADSMAQSTFDSVKQHLQLPDAVRQRLGMKPKEDPKKSGKKSKTAHGDAKGQAAEPDGPAAVQEKPFDPYTDTTLLLKNGERITGKLVGETAERVILNWEYGNATFKASEIVQIIRPIAKAEKPASKTAYQPGDALQITLSSGEQLTGELVQELPDEWIFRFDFGEVNFKKTEVLQIELASTISNTRP